MTTSATSDQSATSGDDYESAERRSLAELTADFTASEIAPNLRAWGSRRPLGASAGERVTWDCWPELPRRVRRQRR